MRGRAWVTWWLAGLGLLPSVGAQHPQAQAESVPRDCEAAAAQHLPGRRRVQVFSVAQHLQPWFQAPAAVHVIPAEEIWLSGANSWPELLGLAPGLDVARVNLLSNSAKQTQQPQSAGASPFSQDGPGQHFVAAPVEVQASVSGQLACRY